MAGQQRALKSKEAICFGRVKCALLKCMTIHNFHNRRLKLMFSSYEALTSGMSSNIHLTNSKLLPTSAGSEAS